MLPVNPIKQPDTQLRVLGLLIGVGFCVLLAGLWFVQVFSSKKFAESLEDQAVRSVRIPAVRGKILDRNGQPFAENRPSYNVELYLAELGRHFHAEYMRIRPAGARLTRSDRESLEWAARYNVVSNITAQVGDWLQQPQVIDQRKFQRHYNEVRALPISILQNLNAVQVARFAERPGVFPGLDLEIQPMRVYPHGGLAAHVLGSLTRDDSSQEEEDAFYHYRLPDWKGVTGMEGIFDGQMRGTAGTKSMTVNRLGYRQQETVLRAPEPGDNLVLTLDFKLQRAVEAALAGPYGAQTRGAAVVMDVQTGDVLAMASAPSFEPAEFMGRISTERWTNVLNHPIQKPMLNRATQENYHPGSILKLLTALAALEMEKLDPKEVFNVEADPERPGKGCIHVGNRKVRDTVAAGPYNFKKALMHSSNSYFIHQGLKPGVLQKMIMLGEKFHLGERTGILPRQETAGEFPDQTDLVRRWQPGDTANLCIGQGKVSVSPLQIALLTSAIANGGKVFWPRLVLRLEPSDPQFGEKVSEFPPRVRDELGVKPENLRLIHEAMLAEVEEAGGTGTGAIIRGLKIGGKTGTAEIEQGGKVVDKTTWFASFAPVDRPKWAVVVMVESGASGGKTCAPIARLIYQALLNRERDGGQKPATLALN
ncbi:MAG: penicillin-binding protein 2 [Limisphaerales bacterium]|nr:MAG: penicillin-binding protein 2 [Limisphaerales bacterium]TXT46448.1 MAG: penicillin-binding protein 2 [Limisphaerales bacterium]